MTDPTVKPCPVVWQLPFSVERHPSACDCHGTGTVPLTTGELFDALKSRVRVVCVFTDSRQDDRIAVDCWDGDNPEQPLVDVEADTLDDALRAALRAVTE